jgi:hypothetical protein
MTPSQPQGILQPTPTATATASTKYTGLSTGAKAGIGVGAGLGCILLLALVYWLGRRHTLSRSTSAQLRGNGQATGDKTDVVPPYELSVGGRKKGSPAAVEIGGQHRDGLDHKVAELLGDEKRRSELESGDRIP